MANVKVRKNRHLRTGADVNPFPTAEQVLTGKVPNASPRLVAKSHEKMKHCASNDRAQSSGTVLRRIVESVPAIVAAVGASPVVVAAAEVVSSVVAAKVTRKKAKKRAKAKKKVA